jgi:crossover junction endodeoxyribonuclease RuvC
VDAVRILGIDPGSRYLGYGVVERGLAGRILYVECGVIESTRTAPLHVRLAEIHDGLGTVVDELRPSHVAVEGVFHGVNARSALQLGHSRGIALMIAGARMLDMFEYAPATVKRQVAGHGAATKEQVAQMVKHLCSLRRAPRLDASDALAVALCHAFRMRATRTQA